MRVALAAVLVATLGVLPGSGEAGSPDRQPPRTTHATTTSPGQAVVVLRAADDTGVLTTQYRVDGGPWRTYQAPERRLLDRTEASFRRWRQAGPGEFVRRPDGSVETRGGLGMIWHPEAELRDVSIRLQWRDARTDGCCSNAGVFVRFPDPERATALPRTEAHRCQLGPALTQPEWVAISCGHEIQVNDGTVDPQATGSVYNFKPLDRAQGRPTRQGTWNDYEVRVSGAGDYTITVLRNGRVLNTFRNTPGQQPARPIDPPTDARQFASGFLGLQNHGDGDVVQFRDVRVRDLDPRAAAFTVRGRGRHVVEYRSTDLAGNVEPVRRAVLTVR